MVNFAMLLAAKVPGRLNGRLCHVVGSEGGWEALW